MKKIFIPIVLWYLRMAAKLQLTKIKPTIVGVGGSSGKSSLTQLIKIVLQERYAVDSSKEKNSETGIPLHILNIHMEAFSYFNWLKAILLAPLRLLFYWPKTDMLIAEMGIDSPVEPKNMSYLLKIVTPTVGVVTNVSLEHSVYFEPFVDEINPEIKEQKILSLTAEQETLLLASLPEAGTAIVNLDDESIFAMRDKIQAKKITLSLSHEADLVGKDIHSNLSRFSMLLSYAGKNYPLVIGQPLPKHYAYEFLFAVAVGLAFDIPIEQSIVSLQKHFSLPAGRLSFFKGIHNSIIIDSSYNNATLPPVLDILDFMKEISGKRRKVVILGDMRELGEASQDMHEEVARKILQTVDFAVLIGPLSEKYMVPILKDADFPFENFPDVTSGKEAVLALIRPEDVVLVKGSQNTLFLERIVEMLLLDKKDVARLTRRGEFWDKKRSEVL